MIYKLTDKISIKKQLSIFISCIVFYIIFSFSYLYFKSNIIINSYYFNSEIIETEKGNFKVYYEYESAINNILEYINKTDSEERTLIIPEGAALNYLTNRKTDNKLYALIPTNVEIFGSKQIIEDIKNNQPENIIINSKKYTDYKTKEFCKSYGKEICQYISENYDLINTEYGKTDVEFYRIKQ